MEAEQVLTAKQQRFCDEYLIDLNATQAAIRAGYAENTANSGNLLTNPLVQEYIAEAGRERALKLKLSHEMVLLELAKVAFCTMDDYYHADGRLKKMEEIDIDAKAALAVFDVKVYNDEDDGKKKPRLKESIRIRLHNKLRALDLLGKHLALGEGKKNKKDDFYDPDFDFSPYVDPEDLNIVKPEEGSRRSEGGSQRSDGVMSEGSQMSEGGSPRHYGVMSEGGSRRSEDVLISDFGCCATAEATGGTRSNSELKKSDGILNPIAVGSDLVRRMLDEVKADKERELMNREERFLREQKEDEEKNNLLFASIVKSALEQYKHQYDNNDDIAKLPYLHPLQMERAKDLLRKNCLNP